MRIKRIVIDHDDIHQLGEIIIKDLGKEYIKVTDEMIVIGAETYRLASNSAQWVMVVLKKEGDSVEIDLMDTDHGTGLISFRLTESKFITKAYKHFKHHCELNGWDFRELS